MPISVFLYTKCEGLLANLVSQSVVPLTPSDSHYSIETGQDVQDSTLENSTRSSSSSPKQGLLINYTVKYGC